MSEPYLLYTPQVEQEQPNESRLIEDIIEHMAQARQQVFDKHRHAVRDAHAKSRAFLKGILTVPV